MCADAGGLLAVGALLGGGTVGDPLDDPLAGGVGDVGCAAGGCVAAGSVHPVCHDQFHVHDDTGGVTFWGTSGAPESEQVHVQFHVQFCGGCCEASGCVCDEDPDVESDD
ncbi:MAG TPA: hypothetical protein VEH52_05910 [Gaiellaceae bacterium]|nr:hypothetical protein [Gaiellaceae bacterium]